MPGSQPRDSTDLPRTPEARSHSRCSEACAHPTASSPASSVAGDHTVWKRNGSADVGLRPIGPEPRLHLTADRVASEAD